MDYAPILSQQGRFEMPLPFAGQPDRSILIHGYRAKGYRPGKPWIFVQHGMLRNGDDYRDFWIDAADKHDLLIIAPTFPDADFPSVEGYNNGFVLDAANAVTDRAEWVFQVPILLAEDLIAQGVVAAGQGRIFGHSAGGQFLHRMVQLFGTGPFEAVGAGNAGWYTLPLLDVAFPEGLAGVGVNRNDLRNRLALPLHIFGGEKDCESSAENLPSNPEALAQGPGRLQRALNFMDVARRVAKDLDCPLAWKFTQVPQVAHDGEAMSRAAAGWWFEGDVPPVSYLLAKGATHNA